MEVLGYDLTNSNSDNVKERESQFGTKNYLYTTNLYSCVAVYAVCGNLKFLGHILVSDDREFSNEKTKKVYEIADEFPEMVEEIHDKVFVGLVYGVSLDDYESDKYQMITEDLDDVINELIKSGLSVERYEDIYSEEFLIDGIENKIVFEGACIEFGLSPVR